MRQAIEVRVNGRERHDEVEPRLLLVHYLRNVLGLTGTHVGCDTSQCGACVVHVDGEAVKSCTLLALQAEGRSVLTIEGVADGDTLHPMQEAFRNNHALQCGFCTPGMILSALELDVGPAVAGLGVIGVAVGFGAQSLVRDYLNGALILIENQYSIGDVVEIAGVSGAVEDFSLRRTTLRDLSGVVHTVPNGEVKVASNRTRTWARINQNITVAFGTDIDKAIQVHGAGGLSQDFPLAAAFAGIRTLRFADGPDEVHKNALARAELKRHRERRG